MPIEFRCQNNYNHTIIIIYHSAESYKKLVCIIGSNTFDSHYTKSNEISYYWTDFDKNMYFEYVSCIHNFTCTFYRPKGILMYDSNNIKHIFTKEERIHTFAKELLFYKRRKELTKAVRVYREKRRKKLEEFLSSADLCKIVDQYL